MNNKEICLFTITLIYYEINDILKKVVYNNIDFFKEEPIIFNSVIKSANIFILYIFIIYTANLFLFSKIKNYTIYYMALIYMKYTIDNILDDNKIGIYQYEFRRTVMWFFTTPLILSVYCDINNMNFISINSQYHVVSNFFHVVLFFFYKKHYNNLIVLVLTLGEGYFIYKLFELKHKRYTHFVIFIWCLFSFMNIIELTNIFTTQDIQTFYLLSDMIAKFTIMLVVNDYEEQTYHIKNNVDLQGISLLTSIKKTLKQFENNVNITPKCKMVLDIVNNRITSFIPIDKTMLKVELLKKILPLELEDDYLKHTKEYKPYNFICVLFTDIVSYTELAKKYDADVIYNLLNEVYTRFDSIVNCYGNLQKIETIGDAYMVVSDIYTNDEKNNVKNMILFAFDLLNAIKTIQTPDGKPLQLRIGINLGKVVVGVLGIEIPRLCVIGNTVNVANRLQTNAEPNTIQISTHIYEIAQETNFDMNVYFEKKENVFLKNLGSRTIYIISSKPFNSNDNDNVSDKIE
jgi:class 3 adenylate cyclase